MTISKNLEYLLTTAVTAVVCCCGTLQADVGYNNNTNVTTSPQYSQAWLGSMGMLFSVDSAISVTSLGAFSNGSPVFSQAITVQLWNSADTLAPIASTVLAPSVLYNQIDQSLFNDISNVILTPGNIYAIVAYGFGDGQPNGNGYGGPVPWTVNPILTPLGSALYDLAANNGLYPTIVDSGPANRYEAGTFLFTAVPEPSTYMMLGSFIAFALLLRSRKTAKQIG